MTKPGRAYPWFKIPKIPSVLRHPSLSILKSLRNASGWIRGPPMDMPSLLHGREKSWSKRIKKKSVGDLGPKSRICPLKQGLKVVSSAFQQIMKYTVY